MSEGPQKSLGEMRATISREVVRLQAEYYGKGPTRAKTYIVDDLVVVVLEETFTRAEKTLAERGERDAIQHIRRSEEHTSELQSPCNLVCRLLLEKKKRRYTT